MAVDQALLDSVKAGHPPAIRIYRWDPPTLSFGRNQPARGLYDDTAARARGIDFVRRPTGGQAVLHDDELTYALVAPVDVVGKPRSVYERVNRALVAGLRSLGVAAEIAAPAGATGSRDWSDACFRRPARGEVVVRGRKLVGSAQRVESRTILQHGSILLGGSQAAAEELLVARAAEQDRAGTGAAASDAGWTTVGSELGRRPGLSELVGSLLTGFESVLGIQLAGSSVSADEAELVERWRVRFRSKEWTWRR